MRKLTMGLIMLATTPAAAQTTNYQTYSYGNGNYGTYGSDGSSYQTYSYGNGNYGTYGSNGESCQTYSYGNGNTGTYCNR